MEPDVLRRGALSPATARERDTREPRVTPVSTSSAWKPPQRQLLFEFQTFSDPGSFFYLGGGFVLFFRHTLTQAWTSEAPSMSKASLPGDTSWHRLHLYREGLRLNADVRLTRCCVVPGETWQIRASAASKTAFVIHTAADWRGFNSVYAETFQNKHHQTKQNENSVWLGLFTFSPSHFSVQFIGIEMWFF